jgi:hypothetical protein
MNAVEIEEAVSALVEEPFDQAEFPYAFLQAFGNKETTLRKLRSGCTNKSDIGGVLQRDNIHVAVAPAGEVSATLAALRESPTTADELEAWFPDVDAGERWRYAMQLYWIRRLKSPFNLAEVAGFNAQRYAQVQGFAKLDPTDELAMLRYLIGTNEDLILNVMNNAERPDASDDE